MSKVLGLWLRISLSLVFGTALCFSFQDGGTFAAPSDAVFYSSPVGDTPKILRNFEKPPRKWMAGHRGIDIAAAAGSEVRSPADGEVTFSGKVVDRTVITVKHPDGKLSSFEPVTEPLKKGTKVKAGDAIARVDSAVRHCEPDHCLHWGVREGKDDYVNPLVLLELEEPSILLPIGDDFSV